MISLSDIARTAIVGRIDPQLHKSAAARHPVPNPFRALQKHSLQAIVTTTLTVSIVPSPTPHYSTRLSHKRPSQELPNMAEKVTIKVGSDEAAPVQWLWLLYVMLCMQAPPKGLQTAQSVYASTIM
jgi:hypothetical protein